MGGIVSSIFGGGQSYEAPAPVQSDPVPARESEVEPEAKAVREAEQRKIRARRAMSGTLLSNPLGGSGQSQGNGLLGITMK